MLSSWSRQQNSGQCSAKKKKKSFIAITRDLLQKVLDSNYLTNYRRVGECSDFLFFKMSSSPCLEVKTGFLSPLSSPMFKKKAVKSRGRGNEKLWACRGPNFEIIHCPTVDFFPLKKKNTQKWYPESISAFGVPAVRGAAIVTIGNRQVPCSQLCSLACFISGSKLPL